MIDARWTRWWQDDLPCDFSQARTKENKNYLIKILEENWLKKRIKGREIKKHHIIRRWVGIGADFYLELNLLAEDLRLVDKKPGFTTVLRDLKSTNECMAAWHLIHCAAMFERGKEGAVSKFYAQTSDSVPDFALTFDNHEIPVEAKNLTHSEQENQFTQWGINLSEHISNSVLVEDLIYPQIRIVIKNCRTLPEFSKITNDLKVGLHHYSGISVVPGGAIEVSNPKYNFWIYPNPVNPTCLRSHKAILILCPRDHNENMRMEGRIKTAASQLKAFNSSISGIVCLGIGKHQDPYYIRSRLLERFKKNFLRGISKVILVRRETYMQAPKRSTRDLISVVTNDSAFKPVPGNIPFQPFALSGKLTEEKVPHQRGIPAYECVFCHFELNNRVPLSEEDLKIYTNPIIQSLTQDMLK